VGFDLYANENAVIRPGETVKIKTGVKAQPSPGYFFLVRDRSSMGSKGLVVTAGVIDNAYRGELIVCLCNTNQGWDDLTYTINKGDKIAQMILLPSYVVEETVGKVGESDRGEKGFGSSGK
jgi:dUTP pyrophosphatase